MCVFCKYKTSLALQANGQTKNKKKKKKDLIIYLAAIYLWKKIKAQLFKII